MSTLQPAVLWLVAIAVAIAVAFIVAKNRNRSGWGFKDVLKNPEYWDGMSQAQAGVGSAVEAAKCWDDDKVASLTKQFIFEAVSSRDAWEQARILRELGERTHPTVLGLLRDSSLYSRLVKPTGKDILPEAPFNRACDLLGGSPGAEAVEALVPFLSDPSEEIRKDAALAIAKTGAATIAPFVRKALSDRDEYVRSYALMGLEFALSRSGLSNSLQAELFPDVLDLLRADRNVDKAANILCRFNSGKAKDYFLSQEVFTAESPILHEVLEVLANGKVSVPHDRLKSLIASLEMQELKYPKTYALGEALRLLGQQQREEDRDFIRGRTTHPEERVAQGAAAGLLCSFGLEGFEQRIWDAEQRSGYESLTEHQRFYSAVSMCDAEINNGGLAQYFVNSSGDRWHDALAGFKAMGFQQRLAVLNEAVAKFGGAGPSTDRSIRQDQLSRLYKRDDSIFDALDNRYYESSEVVGVFASRFVLEHPEGFR
jgi:HEAT repeat protein